MGALLVVVVVLVVLLVAGALAFALRRAERRTFTFPEPVRQVDVDLPAGELAVAAAAGPVTVQRTLRWSLARPATSERVDGDVLRIEVRSRGWWLFGGEVAYRVLAPAEAGVRATTGAGSLTIEGMQGGVELRTGAGAVALAGVGGRVRATTGAGSVRGSGLAAREVEAVSSAGSLALAFAAPPELVEARTNAGSVELSVPDGRYRVHATSNAGRVQVDVPSDPAAPRTLVASSNAGRVQVSRC